LEKHPETAHFYRGIEDNHYLELCGFCPKKQHSDGQLLAKIII
jgi:hypothetical protein